MLHLEFTKFPFDKYLPSLFYLWFYLPLNISGTMQFDPPSKFLQNKGEPPIPWSRRKEEFLTYLKAIDGERLSTERKKNIFLLCLGSEG